MPAHLELVESLPQRRESLLALIQHGHHLLRDHHVLVQPHSLEHLADLDDLVRRADVVVDRVRGHGRPERLRGRDVRHGARQHAHAQLQVQVQHDAVQHLRRAREGREHSWHTAAGCAQLPLRAGPRAPPRPMRTLPSATHLVDVAHRLVHGGELAHHQLGVVGVHRGEHVDAVVWGRGGRKAGEVMRAVTFGEGAARAAGSAPVSSVCVMESSALARWSSGSLTASTSFRLRRRKGSRAASQSMATRTRHPSASARTPWRRVRWAQVKR